MKRTFETKRFSQSDPHLIDLWLNSFPKEPAAEYGFQVIGYEGFAGMIIITVSYFKQQ